MRWTFIASTQGALTNIGYEYGYMGQYQIQSAMKTAVVGTHEDYLQMVKKYISLWNSCLNLLYIEKQKSRSCRKIHWLVRDLFGTRY